MIIICMESRSETDPVTAVFVDTAAWIALLDTSDRLYLQAHQVMRELGQHKARLITTEWVFVEVADALSAPAYRTKIVAFIREMRRSSVLHVLSLSQTLLDAGWALYEQRPDKEWSLTDCISFAAMAQERLTSAFTSDHHYEQAGYVKLMNA